VTFEEWLRLLVVALLYPAFILAGTLILVILDELLDILN
jgi:type IV secretory pathway VirB6-like protein